jgi:signal transduction histidine kinase
VQGSDGTGLRLAIVSRLVELMDGEIKIVLQLGKGSTFTVILPLEAIANQNEEENLKLL